jgi:hypothetical protein
MSKENITLVYSAIIREKHTILSEYTEFSGNFSQIITQIMKEIILKLENIPKICRTYFYYGKYSIFCLKYNKVYIITMFPNIRVNNKEIIFAFLYSIFDSLKTKKGIDIEKLEKMKAYTLSSFSEVFAEKIKLFNSNSDSFIKLIKNLQIFEIFNAPKGNYELELNLPILSKTQTHTEKNKKIGDDEIVGSIESGSKNSFRNSFNSYMTYDSLKEDLLDGYQGNNSGIDINNNLDGNKNEKFESEIEIKELDENKKEIKALKINDTTQLTEDKSNLKINNTDKKCLTKLKIIIIVLIVLIILGIILCLIFLL